MSRDTGVTDDVTDHMSFTRSLCTLQLFRSSPGGAEWSTGHSLGAGKEAVGMWLSFRRRPVS